MLVSLPPLHAFCSLQEYNGIKDMIIRFELYLLKTFGFIVHAQHPHTFVVNYVRMLMDADDGSPLFQEAWNMCNDRYVDHWSWGRCC